MRFKQFRDLLFLSFLLLLCRAGVSQNATTPFGEFTADEIALTQCGFDKEAEAVVLLDQARSTYDEQYQLITQHCIRMKVLKERGIENGNIRILFYGDDHFETIRNINAVVLNMEGNQPVRKALERKSIYTKKLNAYYSEVTFALPDIKVGSLFEYEYESVMQHYGGLREWVFQKELPVVLSSYDLTIVPNAEFNYSVYKSAFMPITVNRDPRNGTVLFEMRNIPGLRDEAFMGAANDYLQRVKFQFSGFNRVENSGYSTTVSSHASYTNSWSKLARELLDSRDFGLLLTKSVPEAEAMQAVWAQAPDAYGKMKNIYQYVRSQFSWNGMYAISTDNNLKSIWEKKTGTKAEVNLVLLNLLKSAGLDASPLLVSERDHGRVDTTYPYRSQFNNVVAYVTLGDKHFILDGTDLQTPAYLIPFPLLNTTGFIVDKKNPGLLPITDGGKKSLSLVNLTGTVTDAGLVQMQAIADQYEYAKATKLKAYSRDKKEYEKSFLAGFDPAMVDSFSVSGATSDSAALHHAAAVHYALEKNGDFVLLKYNFFTGFNRNPFIQEQRFTDIDFGCTTSCILNATFVLPEHLKTETLPKNIRLMLPDKSMEVVRQVVQNSNTIQIGIRVNFSKTLYAAQEYEGLQSFYKQLLDLLNEPIVLKPKA